jgi:catalase
MKQIITTNAKTTTFSPSSNWQEIIKPDEKDLFESFAHFINETQKKIEKQTKGQRLRGFHAKIHAGFLAEFKVPDNLPDYARLGIFRHPRIFEAVVRFSNGTPFIQADKKPEPRGMAIKLFGVPGEKLLPNQENAMTQDFLGTSHSVTSAVRNIGQFMAFIKAEQKNRLTLPFNLVREVGFSETIRILYSLARTVLFSKVTSMATENYEGTAPIKFGPYAVKFTIAPANKTKRTMTQIDKNNPNFLRDELTERIRVGDLFFDFLVQFFVNETLTPIEDTSIFWKPADAPYLKIAEIRIPQSKPNEDLNRKVNQLSFTPWHTTEDHRPLGNIMRARKIAYGASSSFRQSVQEPTQLPL